MIYDSVTSLIGGTPLVRLNNIIKKFSLPVDLIAKAEFINPAGSVKDRVALAMLDAAERGGALKKGGVIVEPTSGNTGIALAAISAARGYRAIIVMPDNMSAERVKFIKAYGAEVVLTDGKSGMRGATEKAESIAENLGGTILGQFSNIFNAEAHFYGTGAEIWEQTGGNVDILVAGVGTGGTVTGAGRYLKSKNPTLYAVAVQPAASPVLSGGESRAHGIQGIGAGFIPEILDTSVYDEVASVGDGEAFSVAAEIARSEGMFVGLSSGAALAAALKIAARKQNAGKRIVVIFPDSGDRYLSLYN